MATSVPPTARAARPSKSLRRTGRWCCCSDIFGLVSPTVLDPACPEPTARALCNHRRARHLRGGFSFLTRSLVELWPEVVAEAGRLRKGKRKGGRLSYPEISARLKGAGYCNERGQPFNPHSVRAMIEVRECAIAGGAVQIEFTKVVACRPYPNKRRW